MCGLFGFARATKTTGLVDTDLSNFASSAMLAGVLRGVDSFGMYFQRDGEHPINRIAKFPVCATTLFNTPVWEELIKSARNSNIVIGHHRAKTTGTISTEAAHPYCVYSAKTQRYVYGAHNGSLISWYSSGGKGFVTDSEYLFHQIAENGPEALRDIKGAYAVVFTMSDQPGKLFMARNEQRPLAYGLADDGKYVVYGSEHQMLEWLASRHGLKMNEKLAKGPSTWADVTPLKLHVFPLDKPGDVEITLDLSPPKVVPPQAAGGTVNMFPSTTPSGNGRHASGDISEKLTEIYGDKAKPKEIMEAWDWNELGGIIEFDVSKVVHDPKTNTIHAVWGVCHHTPFGIPAKVLLRSPNPIWWGQLQDGTRGFRAPVAGMKIGATEALQNDISLVVCDPVGSYPLVGQRNKIVHSKVAA